MRVRVLITSCSALDSWLALHSLLYGGYTSIHLSFTQLATLVDGWMDGLLHDARIFRRRLERRGRKYFIVIDGYESGVDTQEGTV